MADKLRANLEEVFLRVFMFHLKLIRIWAMLSFGILVIFYIAGIHISYGIKNMTFDEPITQFAMAK